MACDSRQLLLRAHETVRSKMTSKSNRCKQCDNVRSTFGSLCRGWSEHNTTAGGPPEGGHTPLCHASTVPERRRANVIPDRCACSRVSRARARELGEVEGENSIVYRNPTEPNKRQERRRRRRHTQGSGGRGKERTWILYCGSVGPRVRDLCILWIIMCGREVGGPPEGGHPNPGHM